MASPPKTRYLPDAALLAVEILSEADTMSRMLEKLKEYEHKGVSNIWVIDTRLQQMFTFRSGSLEEVAGDVIATRADPRLELTREEIFQE